jgi:hypothetical protein
MVITLATVHDTKAQRHAHAHAHAAACPHILLFGAAAPAPGEQPPRGDRTFRLCGAPRTTVFFSFLFRWQEGPERRIGCRRLRRTQTSHAHAHVLPHASHFTFWRGCSGPRRITPAYRFLFFFGGREDRRERILCRHSCERSRRTQTSPSRRAWLRFVPHGRTRRVATGAGPWPRLVSSIWPPPRGVSRRKGLLRLFR